MPWKEYCPLMKEVCVDGHVKSMGEDNDGRQIKCAYFVHMMGTNPQTGQPVNEGKCAVNWLPILLVENANEIRKTAASTDKVASEVAKTRGAPMRIELSQNGHLPAIQNDESD